MQKVFKDKRMAVLLVLIVLALMVTGIVSAATDKSDERGMTGTLSIKNAQYFLTEGKAKQLLAMIPPAAMDSLNFHPADKDTLSVKGTMHRGILVVREAWWKGQYYAFRDSLNNPAWKGTATWASNPKTCIGCRLCFNNCPAEAISMENMKGAFKAVIDQTKCTGCNTCIVGNGKGFAGCPVKAITK